MVQVIRSGSHEQNYNRAVLPPSWQKDNISHLSNHSNNIKKRKLNSVKKMQTLIRTNRQQAMLPLTTDSQY